MRTSECAQIDLLGEPMGHYCIVFGRLLHWSEIRWHVLEAFRLGMVDKGFVVIRKFQSITIRVSARIDRSMKEFSKHYQRAKRILRGRPRHRYVFGLACETLAKEWLQEKGWKVYRSFGSFSKGLSKRLTNRQIHFLKDFLICDFYICDRSIDLPF